MVFTTGNAVINPMASGTTIITRNIHMSTRDTMESGEPNQKNSEAQGIREVALPNDVKPMTYIFLSFKRADTFLKKTI